jgi:SAM-dependent methyltransferase
MDDRADARTGQTDGRDDLRANLHRMWASVAPGWAEHADFVDDRGAAETEALLERAAPQPGDRVLELACGPGATGMAAATLVAPGGEVVMSDVVAEMTAIAAARADAAGLTNVSTRELDIEQIEEPDGAYDVVLCRHGLMFALDPARGAREIRRVLKPGGRVALGVWGPREDNPWLGLVLDSVSAQIGAPVPPPGIPGPFALQDAGRLAALLTEAGLLEVSVTELSLPTATDSFDEWWTRTTALAGPLSAMLKAMPPEAGEAIRERAREAVAPYATVDGGLEFPGVGLVASGRA